MSRRVVVVVPLIGLACGSGELKVPSGPPLPPTTSLPRALNWRDPVFGEIQRGAAGTCFVALPFAEPPTAVVPPETRPVPCPPAMLGPAWDDCTAGTLIQAEDRTCACRVFGNPPPPPRPVTCPADPTGG